MSLAILIEVKAFEIFHSNETAINNPGINFLSSLSIKLNVF